MVFVYALWFREIIDKMIMVQKKNEIIFRMSGKIRVRQKRTIRNIKKIIVTSVSLNLRAEILDMQFPNKIVTGEKAS